MKQNDGVLPAGSLAAQPPSSLLLSTSGTTSRTQFFYKRGGGKKRVISSKAQIVCNLHLCNASKPAGGGCKLGGVT